jgi:parallel beta-helix repeat protein
MVGSAFANFFPPPPELERVFIRSDGVLNPSSAPIQREGNTYILTADLLNFTLEVQRSGIIFDGAGHVMDGFGIGEGIAMTKLSDVTVKNVTLRNFRVAVQVDSSSNCSFKRVSVTGSEVGIYLYHSSENEISYSNVTANVGDGIVLYDGSNHNVLADNLISQNGNGGITFEAPNTAWNQTTCDYNSILRNDLPGNNAHGILIWGASGCRIEANNVSRSSTGIQLDGQTCQNNTLKGNLVIGCPVYGLLLTGLSNSNTISGNNIAWNGVGVKNSRSENNVFYNNNFITNVRHVVNTYEDISDIHSNATVPSINAWCDPVSRRGNYWTDYSGRDDNSDEIGDTSKTVDANNTDQYPLMKLNGIVPDFLVPAPTPTATLSPSDSPSASPTSQPSYMPETELPAVSVELAAVISVSAIVLCVALILITRTGKAASKDLAPLNRS